MPTEQQSRVWWAALWPPHSPRLPVKLSCPAITCGEARGAGLGGRAIQPLAAARHRSAPPIPSLGLAAALCTHCKRHGTQGGADSGGQSSRPVPTEQTERLEPHEDGAGIPEWLEAAAGLPHPPPRPGPQGGKKPSPPPQPPLPKGRGTCQPDWGRQGSLKGHLWPLPRSWGGSGHCVPTRPAKVSEGLGPDQLPAPSPAAQPPQSGQTCCCPHGRRLLAGGPRPSPEPEGHSLGPCAHHPTE